MFQVMASEDSEAAEGSQDMVEDPPCDSRGCSSAPSASLAFPNSPYMASVASGLVSRPEAPWAPQVRALVPEFRRLGTLSTRLATAHPLSSPC